MKYVLCLLFEYKYYKNPANLKIFSNNQLIDEIDLTEDIKMKNGIYRSDNATYYVLNEKILMNLMGEMYKTTKSFMQGDYEKELCKEMIDEFDGVYNKVKEW